MKDTEEESNEYNERIISYGQTGADIMADYFRYKKQTVSAAP